MVQTLGQIISVFCKTLSTGIVLAVIEQLGPGSVE